MLPYYIFEEVVIGADEFLARIGGQGVEVITAPGVAMIEPLAV